MARVARFKLYTPNHTIGAPEGVTVEIDRSALIFGVRIKRRKRVFVLPLYTVAGMVVHRIVLAEAAAKRAAKKARRRARRSG